MIGLLRRRRARGDRGATLVEFAVVAPLIFFMLGGMLDIGLTVLGRSVASGAAREGARVGIIKFDLADTVGSPNNTLVKAAVDAKLVGLVKPDTGSAPYVAVRCLDGGTKASKACTRAAVRIDYDLLEVTVKWRSISATGGTFTPSNLTDVARMVIVGDAGVGGVACVGSGGTIGFSTTTASVTEGNSSTAVSLTVTRSSGSCVTTVAYATSPTGSNPATADSDYTTTNSLVTFLVGETSKTISIPIIGDAATEPNETFRVTLSSPVNGTIGAANPATVTIVDDDVADAAPVLTALRMFDLTGDGRVDSVTADFNEPLAAYTAGTTPWTLANVPSNGTLASVAVSGSRATLTITPGSGSSGAPNTAVGSFTVALAQNPNGVRDAAGNRSSFAATAPLDRAAPILLSVADTNGVTNGQAATGDTLTLTFSEAIAGGSIPLTTNVAMTGGTSGTLAMPGLIVTTALNAKSSKLYSNACTLNFNGSAVSSNAVSKTITVVLGVLGSGCTSTAGESNPGIAFAPASSLTDGADIPNAAAALSPPFTTANNFNLF